MVTATPQRWAVICPWFISLHPTLEAAEKCAGRGIVNPGGKPPCGGPHIVIPAAPEHRHGTRHRGGQCPNGRDGRCTGHPMPKEARP